jgi:hypothetical protein
MQQHGGTVEEACCGIIGRNAEHVYLHLYFERSSVLTLVSFKSPVTDREMYGLVRHGFGNFATANVI